MIESPEELLGRSLSEREVRAHLRRYGAAAEPYEREHGFYLSFYGAGVELVVREDGRIETVFVHNSTDEGYSPYAGGLPFGLRLDQPNATIRSRLGPPVAEYPARDIEGVGRKGPMERYDRGSLSIHVDYAEATGRVCLITFTSADSTPTGEKKAEP